MVHDLIPMSHPQHCRPTKRLRHERRIETILSTAAAVVTNSSDTLQALSSFATNRGFSMPPPVKESPPK
jgi:hypothetical protein